MNSTLLDKLAREAGWTPVPGADFANSLQELYNQKLVRLVVQECYAWCVENGGPSSSADLQAILEHFGFKPHHYMMSGTYSSESYLGLCVRFMRYGGLI